MQVTPDEIGIDELYKVDSPYKATLQKSYEEFKKSKDYKDHKLTQDQYLMAMHHTRSFEYVSIDDEKANIEMWRDIALGVGVVVLTIFCPPAGAVTNTIFAGLELSSAVSGKDWGTGRELNDGERALRGAFALVDLIPAGKYLGGLAKTGKTAGVTAVKTSLKTSLKEGFEQGAKNVDNFKGLWTGIKTYGDNFIHSIPEYSRQLTNQVKNFADEKVLNFSKVAQEGVERAKNFSLEFRQEASEQLAKHSDEIANTAKVVDKVDDAVDANRIPRYVEDTISQINSNKGNPPDGFKGGKLYKNKPLNGEELLPDGTKYKEYDVHPYQKGIPRGPERIVIGEDGSVWYTQDHYQTFTRVK